MAKSDTKTTIKLILSVVLIVVAVILIVPRLKPRSDAARSDLLGAMCYELAAQVDALAGESASIVCIGQANSRSMFSSEKALGIFRSAVQRDGHKVVAEEYIPLGEMHTTDQGIHLKPSALQDVADRHQDATVLVSFVGEPYLEEGDAEPLSGSAAKLVVVSFGGPELDQQLQNGLVDLALVFSEETPLTEAELGSPEEIKRYISFRKAGE